EFPRWSRRCEPASSQGDEPPCIAYQGVQLHLAVVASVTTSSVASTVRLAWATLPTLCREAGPNVCRALRSHPLRTLREESADMATHGVSRGYPTTSDNGDGERHLHERDLFHDGDRNGRAHPAPRPVRARGDGSAPG